MKGDEIRTLRTRLGLTQRKLAESLGVSPNTVARWERDELRISTAMSDRLLAVAESLPSGAAITRTSGIALDPHHRAILDGLNGRLDPEVFELCAVDLLQTDWPTLVPVRGGRDHGFDGAVADRDSQEPFPLVTTTGKSLVRNFRTSLESAKRNAWKPKRVLFATSQRITPAIRRKLFDAARERGVWLVQTYDQDWFAGRLYREPQWCKRLLGVTGRPHALSVFPVSRRPVLGNDVLGREREKKWILEHREDCLLVGEPGSGKTFLLRALALEGKALFLVDEDREQISIDIRRLNPKAVIVDDAHVRPTSIGTLTQIRSEVHADFRIIATCWPGDANGMKSELQVGQSDVLTLDLVDADTMIEIIKSVGIRGPNELLRAIRSQAAGRPGLATTLAHLCLIGDIRAATSGEGLVDTIAPDLDRVLGFNAMRLLAPFALGGDAGARQEDVAEQLNMSLLKISSALATLGAAGIVRERRGAAISVEPPPMRWVLVQRVFFDGPGSLPVERFLSAVQNRTDCLRTLIGARARGAAVPDLERWLEDCNSESLWTDYASLGPTAVRFALVRHPEIINALAEPALLHRPDEAIPMLLSRVQDECAAGVALESALHPLEQWIKSGNTRGKHEAIERRKTLLRCSEAWWRQSRNCAVSVAAMGVALDPDFDFATQDPGVGTRITFSKAILDADVINQLAMSWPTVMTVVNEATDIPWTTLIELVTNWCHAPLSADNASRDAAAQFLPRILNDLALASRQCPGVQHRIAQLSERVGTVVETTMDAEFECLYPQDSYDTEDLDREHQRLEENALQLAERWRSYPADRLASFLGRLETEARRAGITYPRLTPVFCRSLAKTCPDPTAVAKIFIRKRIPADLVETFLQEAVDDDQFTWSIVSDCLEDNLYVVIGIRLAICHELAPPKIVSLALQRVDQAPRLIEHCCAIGEISQGAISRMFRSPEPSTAIPAAIGHWQAHRFSRTQIPLDDAWRCAVLLSAETRLSSLDGCWIGEILKSDSGLTVEWLTRFLDCDQRPLGFHALETAKNVIVSLDAAQRIGVLNAIHPPQRVMGASEVVNALVGNDPEVYRYLLQSEKLKEHHLSPLMGEPSTDWRSIAVLALDHEYSCQDLVDATLDGGRFWEGPESEMWAKLRHRFENLQDDDDCRIARVGQLGAEIPARREERAREREREEAIYGIS